MSRTDKIIKSLLYLLGALATIGFLMTKSRAALSWATASDYRYGDLYRLSRIERFKPPAPLGSGVFAMRDSFDQGKQRADEGDSILLGDSFGFCDWGEAGFDTQLRQKLGISMFSVYSGHHHVSFRNPYTLLNAQTNHTQVPRVLVFEIVERSIQGQFADPISANDPRQEGAKAKVFGWARIIQEDVFDNTEARHEALLKHNLIISPAVGIFNTTVFELFRQMPGETPWYSLKPPFLFYKEEVACFQSVHDEQLVSKVADNLGWLARNLQEHFGYTLVFLPIPNKITLYSRYATDKPYDDFLPRLCSALKMRGVHTIELLPLFQRQTELLYWPTDTHWNNQGIHLAVEQTLKNWPLPHPE